MRIGTALVLVLAGCAASPEPMPLAVAAASEAGRAGAEETRRFAAVTSIMEASGPERASLLSAEAERRAAQSGAQRGLGWAAAVERQRAEIARTISERQDTGLAPRRVDAAEVGAAAAAAERNYQAAVICRERGNMAAAQPVFGGPGMTGAINAGVQQGVAGSQVEAACLRAYQATGIMPSY